MSRRAIAKPGQSYLEVNKHRVIQVAPDVLDIKTRIETQWPNLEVHYDQIDETWLIIQTWVDEKGEKNESLALEAKELCEDTIRRVAEADPTHRAYVDPIEHVDKHNAQIERDRERKFEDEIGDFGEHFIHALRKDGVYNHDNIEGGKRKKRARAARRAI